MKEVHYRVEASYGKHAAVRYTRPIPFTRLERRILGRFDDIDDAADCCRRASISLAARCVSVGRSLRVVLDLKAHDSSLNS
jgi:hypothetical protein